MVAKLVWFAMYIYVPHFFLITCYVRKMFNEQGDKLPSDKSYIDLYHDYVKSYNIRIFQITRVISAELKAQICATCYLKAYSIVSTIWQPIVGKNADSLLVMEWNDIKYRGEDHFSWNHLHRLYIIYLSLKFLRYRYSIHIYIC